MIRFWNCFVKLTGWLVQFICFRTKVLYEDKSLQSRRIKGAAIIVSNHTSVYDYAVLLFVFFSRTLRCQMAELLFDKKPLGWLLKRLGGIKVERAGADAGFMSQSAIILKNGGIVGIFPEGRLPRKDETPPIAFKPGAARLALLSGVKVIPVYTNGSYFNLKRARVVIGKPMEPDKYPNASNSQRAKDEAFANAMRERILELRRLLDEDRVQAP